MWLIVPRFTDSGCVPEAAVSNEPASFTGSRAIMRAHDAALRERVARLEQEIKERADTEQSLTRWVDEACAERDEARRLAENWRAMAVSAGWYSETLPWEAVVERGAMGDG